ncbi:hypothetical protein AB0D45_10775 [Streptomyces sp. NPDC048352]|uniref:hypothetical protein n=1 Tax=Streptomyces sp. NPDC048352 TaxID=3154718 RepID=UPI0034449BA7
MTFMLVQSTVCGLTSFFSSAMLPALGKPRLPVDGWPGFAAPSVEGSRTAPRWGLPWPSGLLT